MVATRASATVTAMMWAMATTTRMAGSEEGKGKSGKGNDNSN